MQMELTLIFEQKLGMERKFRESTGEGYASPCWTIREVL